MAAVGRLAVAAAPAACEAAMQCLWRLVLHMSSPLAPVAQGTTPILTHRQTTGPHRHSTQLNLPAVAVAHFGALPVQAVAAAVVLTKVEAACLVPAIHLQQVHPKAMRVALVTLTCPLTQRVAAVEALALLVQMQRQPQAMAAMGNRQALLVLPLHTQAVVVDEAMGLAAMALAVRGVAETVATPLALLGQRTPAVAVVAAIRLDMREVLAL